MNRAQQIKILRDAEYCELITDGDEKSRKMLSVLTDIPEIQTAVLQNLTVMYKLIKGTLQYRSETTDEDTFRTELRYGKFFIFDDSEAIDAFIIPMGGVTANKCRTFEDVELLSRIYSEFCDEMEDTEIWACDGEEDPENEQREMESIN